MMKEGNELCTVRASGDFDRQLAKLNSRNGAHQNPHREMQLPEKVMSIVSKITQLMYVEPLAIPKALNE